MLDGSVNLMYFNARPKSIHLLVVNYPILVIHTDDQKRMNHVAHTKYYNILGMICARVICG
jgi:hypothetical protein